TNTAPPSAANVNVSCYLGGEMFDSKLIPSIEGESYYITNCTLDTTSQMGVLLNVSVDVDNEHPESDESNNDWTSSIDVLQLTGLGVWDLELDSEVGGRWSEVGGENSETLPNAMEYFFANWTMDNSSASVEEASCSIAFSGGSEGGVTSGSFWDSSQADFDLGNYAQTLFNSSGYVQLDLAYDSGNFTSKVFDMSTSVSYQSLSWSEERTSCPEGMAYINKLNGFCIDKYEASMPSANSTDMGNVTEVALRNNPGSMPAESKKGVVPWVRVSQINARTACSNAGKHLCTDEEWLASANMQGQVYNLPTDLAVAPYGCVTGSSTYCLDHSYESGEACNTGYNKNGESGCYSSEGVWDMTGNVWEWTNETVDVTNPDGVVGWKYPNSTQGWQTTTGTATAIYGNDGTYFPLTTTGRAVRRGGSWSLGALAGPFCAVLDGAPAGTSDDVGFRCCSS
ncbi:MAG: SUMF1/EgtB/PvdO family nonheme iron enzyme, partial [archaeon]